jgi:hypothetical protein
MRILIAVPTIDRDVKHFRTFYERLSISIQTLTDEVDLLILTRHQDGEAQRNWQQIPRTEIVTFENYQIEERHNIGALVEKRNYAIEHAEKNGYDLLWFLDSDTGVHSDTFSLLLHSIELGAEISVAPYLIRQFGRPVVGVLNQRGERTVLEAVIDPQLLEISEPHFPIVIGGLGCTLITQKGLSVRCDIQSITGFIGVEERILTAEDVGFFINAYNKTIKVYCLAGHLVDHMD